MLEGQAAEAAALLEKDRDPVRSDVEFALGRAYAASGQTAKAAEIFANIYYTMPASRRRRCCICRVEKAAVGAASNRRPNSKPAPTD